MNNKIKIIILSLIIIVAIGFSIFSFTNKKRNNNEPKIDGLDVIGNKELLKDTIFGELDITNQVLYTMDGLSTYSAVVTNNSDIGLFKVDNMYVVFTLGDEEIEALALSETSLKSGESLNININFDRDLSKVTKITFKTK